MPVATHDHDLSTTVPGKTKRPCTAGGCMDCIRCRAHHPVNDDCLAAVAEWQSKHWCFPNLTYEVAYENALLRALLP